MRLILASSALLIIYVDPSEPDRLARLTYGALMLYVIYSSLLYLSFFLSSSHLRPPRSWTHWVDVCWYLLFIALSSGTNSIFVFFFFFAILVASFEWGFAAGLRVAIVSATLFTLIGYLTAPAEPAFQLNRFLLRPIYLLVLGYLIAYWGGYEIKLKQRLQFLKDITGLSNPRFGVERTIHSALEQFRSFYDADKCLLILYGEDPDVYHLWRVNRQGGNHEDSVEIINAEIANIFLSPSPRQVIIHRSKRGSGTFLYDIETGETCKRSQSFTEMANMLEANAFVSVPVNYRKQTGGRLYITGPQFVETDIDFILQAIDQIMSVLENIRLIDHLATDAAEREREKIARDIHDGIIQPYIGLQFGLTALKQKLERGDDDLLEHLKVLSELTVKGIVDLRHYVGEVKAGEHHRTVQILPALRRFASRFSAATGIDVTVVGPEDITMSDRLAAEIFHMVTEGVSNIRRHTTAQSARTELITDDVNIILRIENENLGDPTSGVFHPRSLTDRAAALGGQLSVNINDDNRTVVTIQIPL
jgi:signal transduction histidine kinase